MGMVCIWQHHWASDDQFIVQTTKRIHPYAQIWGRHAGNAALFVGILARRVEHCAPSLSIYVASLLSASPHFLCGRSRFCVQRGSVHIIQEIGDERKLSDDDSCA